EAGRFDSSGNLVGRPFFGAATSATENQARVGMNAAGNFDITWVKGSGSEINVARLSPDGTWLSTNTFSVPNSGVSGPSVALDNLNNAVVAYGTNSGLPGGGFHVKARRVFD